MEADLSLSQSHGGLRIANPDADATAQEQTPPEMAASIPIRTSSTRARHLSKPSKDQQWKAAHISPPSSMAYPSPSSQAPLSQYPTESTPFPQLEESSLPGSTSRYSVPAEQFSYQAHRKLSNPLLPSDSHSPSRQYLPPSTNIARPVSSLYPQQHAGSYGSSSSGQNGASYRLRSESSKSSLSGFPIRSNSRGGSAALQAGVQPQDGVYADRPYRQQRMSASGNAPLPIHRNTRSNTNNMQPSPQPVSSPEHAPPPSSEDWQERGASTVIRKEVDQNGQVVLKSSKKGVRDFNFGRTLGEGSYSTVLAATDRQSLQEYAIKVLDKRHIIKEKKVKYVNIERDTLNRLTNHPGIVKLYYTFQDEKSLYYVLDLASGGELLGVLKRMGTFDIDCAQFYGAQVLDAVDYMHKQGVIHRDLKPENILLDDQMYIKITDFGTAKILDQTRPKDDTSTPYIPNSTDPVGGSTTARASSFVGTAEYVSPELLQEKNACKASDLWAFGCIIFQLLAGHPPFKAKNEYLTFKKIVALEYEFPKSFPPAAKDLVERLLVLDPGQRLSIEHIKNHEFFDGIAWGRDLWRRKAPRLKPYNPPQEPVNVIKLNGFSGAAPEPSVSKAASGVKRQPSTAVPARPQPRVITELPPPSQLDIDWSPVLTKTNERILKLGDLHVTVGPMPHTSDSNSAEAPKKLSRFFGGHHPKKKQRLVMVTSSARIILAAAGGDEKKSKLDISLLATDVVCRALTDPKTSGCWCVETKDKLYTFEDSKPSVPDQQSSSQDWLDTIKYAKDLAISQNMSEGSYSGEDAFKDLTTSTSSSTHAVNSLYGADAFLNSGSRMKLGSDADSSKGRKRFSKRNSKSGLAAVF